MLGLFTGAWIMTMFASEKAKGTSKTPVPVVENSGNSNTKIVDLQELLRSGVRQAYTRKNAVFYAEMSDYEEILRFVLVEQEVIRLNPEQAPRWIAQGELPYLMRLSDEQLTRVEPALETYVEDTITHPSNEL